MPKELVLCPICGQKVVAGDFCMACGRPLPQEQEGKSGFDRTLQTSYPRPDKLSPDVAQHPEEDILLNFGFSVASPTSKMLGLVLARAELNVIGEDLDKLIGQIGATRQALLLKHADKDLLTLRAQTLKEALEKTKSRREQLMAVKGSLRIEEIPEEMIVQESKLSKLKHMKRSLDTGVYREEYERIVLELDKLRADLKESADESRALLKTLNKKLREIRRESSRLEARLKIGDMTAGSYEESKLRVDRSIRILEECQEILKSMLAAAKRK
jgi:hypothetical protein